MIPAKLIAMLLATVLSASSALALIAQPSETQPVPDTSGTGDPVPKDWDSPVNALVGVRPLLVVLLEFTDGYIIYNSSALHHPAITPALVQSRIFGPRPSVNDFYREISYGQFGFRDVGNWVWITSWNDPSTPVDESSRGYWDWFSSRSPENETFGGGTMFRWGLRSLDAAGYDFRPLDLNNDGVIRFGYEVSYIMIDAGVGWGGAARILPGGMALDGKNIEGMGCAVGGSYPEIAIMAHELGHQSSYGRWFLSDYYGIKPQSIPDFSLMGVSRWGDRPGIAHLDPLSKLKLGWMTPTPVTRDGWQAIPNSERNPVSYVIERPNFFGANPEYFLVENRWKGSSYDAASLLMPPVGPPLPPSGAAMDIPNEGLLIWHVDESREWDGSKTGNISKVDLARMLGFGNTTAFEGGNPSYYDWWDDSSLTNASRENSKWNGGDRSGVGIWCVSRAGEMMRAHFDVPGPGVVLCPLNDGGNNPTLQASPGQAVRANFRITNTGDSADDFVMDVRNPDGLVLRSWALPSRFESKRPVDWWIDLSTNPARCIPEGTVSTVEITIRSRTNPTVSGFALVFLKTLGFIQPEFVRPVVWNTSVFTGGTARYPIEVRNYGNAAGTVVLGFRSLNAYYIDPETGLIYERDVMPESWVHYDATGEATACGPVEFDPDQLTISVPRDWPGMFTTTYRFRMTLSATGRSDVLNGTLRVNPSIASMWFWNRILIDDLSKIVQNLSVSFARGLVSKLDASVLKGDQALKAYEEHYGTKAVNLFGAAINILHAFENQVEAKRGKGLTYKEADDLNQKADEVIKNIGAIIKNI